MRGQYLAVCAPPLIFASVAQLAEQRIRNAQVAGSIPAGSSIRKPPINVGISTSIGGFFFAILLTVIYNLMVKKWLKVPLGVALGVAPLFPAAFSWLPE